MCGGGGIPIVSDVFEGIADTVSNIVTDPGGFLENIVTDPMSMASIASDVIVPGSGALMRMGNSLANGNIAGVALGALGQMGGLDFFEGPTFDLSLPTDEIDFSGLGEAPMDIGSIDMAGVPTDSLSGVSDYVPYVPSDDLSTIATSDLGDGLAGSSYPAYGDVSAVENIARPTVLDPNDVFRSKATPWQNVGTPDGSPDFGANVDFQKTMSNATPGMETSPSWIPTVGAPTSGTAVDWSSIPAPASPDFMSAPVDWLKNAASNQWDAVTDMSGKDLALGAAKGLGGAAVASALGGALGNMMKSGKTASPAQVQGIPSKYQNAPLPTYGYIGASPSTRTRNQYTGDITKYGYGPSFNFFDPRQMVQMAEGGSVRGPGGPKDDKIPAMLSDGEFVIPTDVVNALGNGNNDRGAGALHQMMTTARRGKRGRRAA